MDTLTPTTTYRLPGTTTLTAIHFKDAQRDTHGLCGVVLVDASTTLTTTLGRSVTCRECLLEMARSMPVLLLDPWLREIVEFALEVRGYGEKAHKPTRFMVEMDERGNVLDMFDFNFRGRKRLR